MTKQLEFKEALKRLFPNMPRTDHERCVRGFTKNKNLSTALDPLEKIVKVQVRAYIRHRLTDYDVLQVNIGKDNAREAIKNEVERRYGRWKE